MATRMEPSKVRYEFVEEVERLDYYVPGGYHPVMLGDQLGAGRYVIAHKLGFGRSATTWLAEDRSQGRLVALKISTAESAERTHELQILSQLAKAKSELPGKATAQNLIDSFTFSGPNGTHRCLVTDAARVNLHEAKDAAYHRLLHLSAARAIAAQLILGVQFIHSQGIVHGDLHLANILLRLPLGMRDMTLEQLRARTREPAKMPVIREDGAPLDPGVPPEVIVPVLLGLAHTPLLIAPPESRFAKPGGADGPLSFPGDIWTLACTVWDVFGDRPPFEAFPATLDEVTIEHVEMLGRLPERWWSKWEERGNWFDEDGRKNVKESLRQWYLNSTRDWNQRFTDSIQEPRERKKYDTFSAEEESAFCNMIKSMLVLEPSERATIEEVVGCEWMQRWGLPEVQKMRGAMRQIKNS
ncbi:kinase domain-containing protein [Aspergillus sclerotiicarbonarius CBS 121057]|uniref:non-specific serine/threonine protein kinase n=1 Tax=Aspergillus sclerotiicarbonarius (strain CBS 121057 / IBT 28362) TaxID=1448318 RepID=A0A319EA44_ASPSB|nr:kinase domain-containing protein [Aspergillus sclerotiicarbonarius CBS 121057]